MTQKVRIVDNVGKITIPKLMRKAMGIMPGTGVSIEVLDGKTLIVKVLN